jgi:hypothetical protein
LKIQKDIDKRQNENYKLFFVFVLSWYAVMILFRIDRMGLWLKRRQRVKS